MSIPQLLRRIPRQGSLTAWFVLAAVIAAGAGGWWLSRGRDVVVVTTDVGALTQIDAKDVATRAVARGRAGKPPLTNVDQVVGHYALRALSSGTALTSDDIGPLAPSGTVVVAVEVKVGGELERGQTVDVVMTGSPPKTISDALVVDVQTPKAKPTVVYVAVPRARAVDLATGAAVIARVP